jgi:hypothetical protein
MKTIVPPSLLLALPAYLIWSITTPKAIAAEPAPTQMQAGEIGNRTIILGDLGHPIGEELTIHGKKVTNGPLHQFRVDTVNNQLLEHSMAVNIEGIDQWSDGTEATMRGCELGEIRYRHIEDGNFGPDDPRFKSHQMIFLSFHPTKLLEPNGLKIAPRR